MESAKQIAEIKKKQLAVLFQVLQQHGARLDEYFDHHDVRFNQSAKKMLTPAVVESQPSEDNQLTVKFMTGHQLALQDHQLECAKQWAEIKKQMAIVFQILQQLGARLDEHGARHDHLDVQIVKLEQQQLDQADKIDELKKQI